MMENRVPDGYSSSLDLFSPPPKDIGLLKREWVDYAPANAITEDAPIEFHLEGNPLRYVDLSKTLLNVKAKVTNGDGTPIEVGANVAPVNLTLQSLWRQVDLSLSQVPLPTVGTNFPYKAYVDVLLQNGEDAKKTQLQAQMYYKDTPGWMDEVVVGKNFGFNWRNNQSARSTVFEMTGPLSLDLAQQERSLISNVAISIKLWRSSSQFCLMAEEKSAEEKPDFKIVITEATLKVCEVTVNPEIMLGHEKALDHAPALYPYTRSEIKTFTVAKGIQNYRIDNVFNGSVPSRLVVGIVAGDAYSGSYAKNPFNFDHYDLNSAAFYVGNVPAPQKPFTPKYGDESVGTYTVPYLSLFGEKVGEDVGNYVALDDYPQGYALYRFDVGEDDGVVKTGNTRLELSFAKELPGVVTIVVYAHFPSLLRVDKSRKILL